MEKQIGVLYDVLKFFSSNSIREYRNHGTCMNHTWHSPFGYWFLFFISSNKCHA